MPLRTPRHGNSERPAVRPARAPRAVALVIRVLLLFVRVELGLRLSSLQRLCRELGIATTPPVEPSVGARPFPRDFARAAIAAVDRVGRWWPWGDTCLRRCLVLGRLLTAADPVLVLGVTRSADGAFGAHSWLEFGGETFDPQARDFARLPW